MKRLIILTVGTTHSGKTTFARKLESELPNSVVIDQDNHAEFIHSYYQKILPKEGPNTFKYTLTETIVDYAVHNTDRHLILCNSNRDKMARKRLLKYFHQRNFTSVLVSFDLPMDVLQARISQSNRSVNILRSATNFEEVLIRQHSDKSIEAPTEDETNYFFTIKHEKDILSVVQSILTIR